MVLSFVSVRFFRAERGKTAHRGWEALCCRRQDRQFRSIGRNMKQTLAQPNRNTINLIVDSAIFLAFLVAMAPHFSGIAVHEWLSIAFGAAIITHLLLHWQWLVEVTKRFFGKAQWAARINYILNLLLFIDITLVIFSGLMISEVALPLVGIQLAQSGSWRGIHGTTADLFLVLVGLH